MPSGNAKDAASLPDRRRVAGSRGGRSAGLIALPLEMSNPMPRPGLWNALLQRSLLFRDPPPAAGRTDPAGPDGPPAGLPDGQQNGLSNGLAGEGPPILAGPPVRLPRHPGPARGESAAPDPLRRRERSGGFLDHGPALLPFPVPEVREPVAEHPPAAPDRPRVVPDPGRPDPDRPGPGMSRDAAHPAAAVGAAAEDLYLGHFGLTERPFALQPDPDFLFWSPAHRRAFAILEYGLMTRAPITLITGEIGAGKTTLLHHLLRSMAAEVQPALISNARGAQGELLRWILMALGLPADPQAGHVDLFAAFQRYLIDQYAAGRRVVLIFDEAQTLARDTLEELRLFTNINAGKDELVQLILVGQPELRAMIARPDMAQFAQRVAASFHLPAMDGATLEGYVGHRLAVAGAARALFEPGALALVQEASRGVPRLVNQLCDLALVYAYGANQQTVSRQTVRHVLEDGVFFGASCGGPKDGPTNGAEGDPKDGGDDT